MRRVARLLLVAVCAAAVGVIGGPRVAGAHATYPARLLVYAQEWSLQPSRATLPAGKVIVQLWNRGQDSHDLRVRRMNTAGAMVGRTQAVKITRPGKVSTANWTLTPGRYMLYCSLPGHMAAGMHVMITVLRG